MIKAVVFDLGNVLVDFDYSMAAKRIKHFSSINIKDIPKLIISSEITKNFEEGKISPGDFFLYIKSLLRLNISYEAFVPIWNEVFFLSAKNRAVFSIANILRGKYKIAILSNINTLHFDYLKRNFPIFDIFHEVFASCDMGIVKPDLKIYNKALEFLGVAPQEVFYTDDREELITKARFLIPNSFVFKGIKKLKNDLIESGVILN